MLSDPYSTQFFTSAWRQFRKRNACPTAITQNVEFLTSQVTGRTMGSNSECVIMLNQGPDDREELAKLLKEYEELEKATRKRGIDNG